MTTFRLDFLLFWRGKWAPEYAYHLTFYHFTHRRTPRLRQIERSSTSYLAQKPSPSLQICSLLTISITSLVLRSYDEDLQCQHLFDRAHWAHYQCRLNVHRDLVCGPSILCSEDEEDRFVVGWLVHLGMHCEYIQMSSNSSGAKSTNSPYSFLSTLHLAFK